MEESVPQLEIFNIDNGDVVAWEALVMVVAEAFGLSLGTDSEPLALAKELSTAQADTAWRGVLSRGQFCHLLALSLRWVFRQP